MYKIERDEDHILIPLLNANSVKKEDFNHKFKDIRTRAEQLYLQKSFGFSINYIHIITSEQLSELICCISNDLSFEKIQLTQGSKQDSVDKLLFSQNNEFCFERTIFRSLKEMDTGIIDKDNEKVVCKWIVNISKISYKKNNNVSKKIPLHIVSIVLTSYNNTTKDEYRLSNDQIIDLVDEGVLDDSSFNDELRKYLKKDTFIAIQLWRHDWKKNEDNTIDAKNYIINDPYYFYSLLTLDKNVFRRSYENVIDVLGWCQSTSGVYLDLFYGTTCLEITLKPKQDKSKYKSQYFNEIGHDSEEFRIWELLALQNKLLTKINQNNLKNVANCITELNKIYDFKMFTSKKGKGEKWMRYGGYLQKISGVESEYKEYKVKNELIKHDKESKLQKLNYLLLFTIFLSILTFILAPIYDNYIMMFGQNTMLNNSTLNNSTLNNSTLNNSTLNYSLPLFIRFMPPISHVPEIPAFLSASLITTIISYSMFKDNISKIVLATSLFLICVYYIFF